MPARIPARFSVLMFIGSPVVISSIVWTTSAAGSPEHAVIQSITLYRLPSDKMLPK